MIYPAAVSISGAQNVVLTYRFLLKKKKKVDLNHEAASTKSSQWKIKGQVTGFFNR